MFKVGIVSVIVALVGASTASAINFALEDRLYPDKRFPPGSNGSGSGRSLAFQQPREQMREIIASHPEFVHEPGRMLLDFKPRLTGNVIQDKANTLATLERMRRGFEAVVDAPLLGEWLIYARNDARSTGVAPMPPRVRQALRGYYSDAQMNRVGYKVAEEGSFAFAFLSMRYGHAVAFALVDTIIFADDAEAQNITLWAHEMKHIEQIATMGVYEFAAQYVSSYSIIESEADIADDRFGGGLEQAMMPTNTNICQTEIGPCMLGEYNPAGTKCSCPAGGGQRVNGVFGD